MKALKYITFVSGIAIDFLSPVLLLGILGHYLDKWLSFDNKILTIIFVILGFISGFYTSYKRIMNFINKDNNPGNDDAKN